MLRKYWGPVYDASSWLLFVLVFLSVFYSQAYSQTTLEKDVAAMRRELAEVRKELGEIKALIAKSPPPTQPTAQQTAPSVATINVFGKPSLGRDDAPVTMVEYSDYQCPFCKRYFDTAYPVLKKEYVDTGKLRIVFRDFPLAGLHPHAKKAHEAAHCAGEQGQYWKMHDTLFENANDLGVASLRRYAETSALDLQKFNVCLDSGKFSRRLDEESSDGVRAGVRATPTFIIGQTGSADKITGKMIVGAQPLPQFKALIDEILSNTGKPVDQAVAKP